MTIPRSRVLAPYRPLPWQVAPWRDKAAVLLLAGAAGGGKSRLAAEKVHGFLLKYPRSTGLVLRKTRESMGNSTVLFMNREVIGNDARVRHIKSEHRFEYYNGSVLAYGGMKDEEQREQIRGVGVAGGVDIAWMEEAVRFTENDYNEVTGRMRGSAAPWTQMILSTNPGPPSHWINQRLILGGEAAIYESRPEDNPYNPPSYIDALKRLTGILKLRLYEGRWVQAEGLVYPEFDLANLTEEEPDLAQPFEIFFDEGYIDPRAILFVQIRPDRVLFFDELYHTRHLAETCTREILDKCATYYGKSIPDELRSRPLEESAAWCRAHGIPLPEIAVGSPEAKEMQQRLRLADIPYRSKPHEIVEGIKAVRELILDGNGYRTILVHRRCKNLIRELTEGYSYPEGTRAGSNEKPIDKDNHAVDALRYGVWLRIR